MNENFRSFEYHEVTVSKNKASLYLDCYENFGWLQDENIPYAIKGDRVTLKLKRDRKILNKMELTRLQRNFEACASEIFALEKAKTYEPTRWAIIIGIIGTAFMAGSTFAVTSTPPIIWLCILLAVPGFIGWIYPYFFYQKKLLGQQEKMAPLIEEKYREIERICEKGYSLIVDIDKPVVHENEISVRESLSYM